MSLTDIGKHAESVEQFINDLAEAFRRKRWVKILSLAGIVFALLLNPASVEYGLGLLGFKKGPIWYSYPVWGGVTAAFFVVAFLLALLTRERERVEPHPSASIIKGLAPYVNTDEDAAWFAKLQRGNILQECLRFCAGEDSFAILSGESGSGKTSFLQAGLSHYLARQGQRPIYVKLTDDPPLLTIRRAVNAHGDHSASGDQHSLLGLLQQEVRGDSHEIVLILDQFEQFFTHQKSKASRQPFIRQMAEWYRQSHSLPVKILVSIRGDFENRLNEFRREMKYALPPQNNLSIEKFEPQEAAQVIDVISREAGIELDTRFVEQLTKYDLADDEGTVSPVDIQILSLMIEGQKSSEERAFNLKAFQKLGGVEGLLERFINRVLAARGTDARRKAAIKVMLALTDQNVRAGALSLKDLKEKLRGDVGPGEIEEAVSWLSRSDVRLITTIQDKNITYFELAHERIIPPLRRLALKETTDIEKAHQTLDRRINEWIGNNRSRRYLLTFKEWRAITRHWTVITLGPQKEQKEEFVSLSKRRFVMIGLSSVAVLAAGLCGYAGYRRYQRWYEERPETQIQYAQRRWAELVDRNKDVHAIKYAVLLLPTLEGRDGEISQRLWSQINNLDPNNRADVLSLLAGSYDELPKSRETESGLNNVRQAADKTLTLIEPFDDDDRSYSLGTSLAWANLASIYSILPNTDQELDKLNKILNAAPNITGPGPRTGTLELLIKAYSKLSRTDEAVRGLLGVLRVVTRDSKEVYESGLLASVAVALSKLPDTKEKADALNEIEQALDEELLVGLRLDPSDNAYPSQWDLQHWITAYSVLPQTVKVKNSLSQCKQAINMRLETIIHDKDTDELSSFADSLREEYLSNPDGMLDIIDKTFQAAVDLKLDKDNSVLLILAHAYSRLAKPELAVDRLHKILPMLVNDSDQKLHVLILLTRTNKKLERTNFERDLNEVRQAFNEALQATKLLKSREQARELISLLEESSILPDSEEEKSLDEVLPALINLELPDRIDMWLLLAEKYYGLSKPEKAEKLLAQVQQTANAARNLKEKSFILSKVASLYAKLHKWVEALEAAQLIGNDAISISALSKILIVWKDTKNGTKSIDVLEPIFEGINSDM